MPVDYKKYPPNWFSEIVPAVRYRSGNRCEVCDLKNNSEVWSINSKSKGRVWLPEGCDINKFTLENRPDYTEFSYKKVKVILTVAHLDHDVDNWEIDISRLLHLCQLCHLNYDRFCKLKNYFNHFAVNPTNPF